MSSEEKIECQITVQPQGWQYQMGFSSTILESALMSGIKLPSSCRNGTCRACLCKLVSGNVRYTIDWPGLSMEEKQEGWILPCVAVPLESLTLEVPLAMLLFEN
ncbi:2Fe-2S iron-sulfur cluster-binding protein [Undibacterium sp. SXout7W]|uniref:2Fe-2S iron-sulfur cluster-binding protein n=1 Tax=Undibacterium sp. SXout7W TaxID=3413049 RepID=UPI003BF1D26E